MILPPALCPHGHRLGPNQVLVGHQPCGGSCHGGHTTWECLSCNAITYGAGCRVPTARRCRVQTVTDASYCQPAWSAGSNPAGGTALTCINGLDQRSRSLAGPHSLSIAVTLSHPRGVARWSEQDRPASSANRPVTGPTSSAALTRQRPAQSRRGGPVCASIRAARTLHRQATSAASGGLVGCSSDMPASG